MYARVPPKPSRMLAWKGVRSISPLCSRAGVQFRRPRATDCPARRTVCAETQD